MKFRNLIFFIAAGMLLWSCGGTTVTVDDSHGVFGNTGSPVSVKVRLNKKLAKAAENGQLTLMDISTKGKVAIPAQAESMENGDNFVITFLMPEGSPGMRKFRVVSGKSQPAKAMKAFIDPQTGQIIISEHDKTVLQYNYRTVYEKDVIRGGGEQPADKKYHPVGGIYLEKYFKAHPGIKRDTVITTQIYAVPRSDYIHPLYGPYGEMLTRDWPDTGHPHHRGIFWAWPEVMYGRELGDIYALQRVFAHPTGNIELTGGPVFAQVAAENLWEWDDEPIVREVAVIRVYSSSEDKRIIDLTIKLNALRDSVTIATRETNRYGGLNVRLQTPVNQDISYFTDEEGANPRRAWSDFNGIFKGSDATSGLMILQHQGNPDYPGVWKEYPNLAWVQPTFPAPNTRYLLSTKKPLILRYRMIVHRGGKPPKKISEALWDAFNSLLAPIIDFEKEPINKTH